MTLGDCFSAVRGARWQRLRRRPEGYDGQFAYYIARDPADSPDCLDVPAYRMQRILLPALGALFSLGQDAADPLDICAD